MSNATRIAGRLLEQNPDPRLVEAFGGQVPDTLEELVIPLHLWTTFTHALILHGRAIGTARKPDCPHCALRDLCTWPGKGSRGAS